jgi:hypothetical protein
VLYQWDSNRYALLSRSLLLIILPVVAYVFAPIFPKPSEFGKQKK